MLVAGQVITCKQSLGRGSLSQADLLQMAMQAMLQTCNQSATSSCASHAHLPV